MVDSRWAQLTYASFDTGSATGGGWQVKQVTGDLTAAETELLRSRVVTNFDPVEALPQFPAPEEISSLPRRLTYLPQRNGTAAYWHSVPSGVDGTGRPGNVFSHVVLDRAVATSDPAIRPIDTWRAGWLAPFGQQQVLAAVAPAAGEPVSGAVIASSSIVEFLLSETTWRGGVFAILLDAVAAARHGGKPVVLVVESVDEAALWIGAVTHLVSPRAARAFGFSVFERVGAIEGVAGRGSLITAVPRADREALAKLESVVVIDTEEAPSLGDLDGQPHRTAGGVPVTVTTWSAMAQVAFQERGTALAVLAKIDEIARALEPNALPLEWPLAMAIGVIGGDLQDADDEASRVIRAGSPATLADHPALWDVLLRYLENSYGPSAGDVWSTLATTASSLEVTAASKLTASIYVQRALSDRAWLVQPGTVPAPHAALLPDDPGPRLREAATAAVAAVQSDSDANGPSLDLALEAVRLGDFLVRVGLAPVAPTDPTSLSPLELLLEQVAVPAIATTPDVVPGTGGELAERVGPIDHSFAANWLRPMVDSSGELQSRPVGARAGQRLLDWLFPAGIEVSIPTDATTLSVLDVELVVLECFRADPAAMRYRALAVLSALARDELGTADPRFQYVSRADWPWGIGDLLTLETAAPLTVANDVVVSALLTAPIDDQVRALNALVNAQLADRGSVELHNVVILRQAEAELLAGHPVTIEWAAAVTAAARWLSTRVSVPASLSPGLEAACRVFIAVDAIASGPSWTLDLPTLTLLARMTPRSVDRDREDAIVAAIVANGELTAEHLARAALLVIRADLDSPVPLGDSAQKLIAMLTLAPGLKRDPFLWCIVDDHVKGGKMRVDDLESLVLQTFLAEVAEAHDPRHPDDLAKEFTRIAKRYWRKLSVPITPPPRGTSEPPPSNFFFSKAKDS